MPRENRVPAAGAALPAARLDALHDCLVLALDASERPGGYSQAERELRSCLRGALRHSRALLAVQAGQPA